jgi:prophage regulatory protein
MTTNVHLPETGFVRLPPILTVFPISRSAFWAGVKTGKYPKPIKLSPRCTAWKVEDIRKLIASYDHTANPTS